MRERLQPRSAASVMVPTRSRFFHATHLRRERRTIDVESDAVRGEDGAALRAAGAVTRAQVGAAATPGKRFIGVERDRFLAFGREQRDFDDLPERAEPGVLVLTAGHCAEIEGGEVTRVRHFDAECLADRQRQRGVGEAVFEQFELELAADVGDRGRWSGQQPRQYQQRTAVKACFRRECWRRRATLVCAEGDDAARVVGGRQAIERIGERGVQRPAWTQQLGLVVERTDGDEVELRGATGVAGEIGGEHPDQSFGIVATEQRMRGCARARAFDGKQGGDMRERVRGSGKGR